MLPAAGELLRPIVTPTFEKREWYRNCSDFTLQQSQPTHLTYEKSTQHNLPVHFIEVCRAGKVQEAPRDDGKDIDENEGELSPEHVQDGC